MDLIMLETENEGNTIQSLVHQVTNILGLYTFFVGIADKLCKLKHQMWFPFCETLIGYDMTTNKWMNGQDLVYEAFCEEHGYKSSNSKIVAFDNKEYCLKKHSSDAEHHVVCERSTGKKSFFSSFSLAQIIQL